MSEFYFVHPWAFLALLLVPALLAIVLRGDRRRKLALAHFGERSGIQVSWRKRWWKRALVLAALLNLTVALLHPAWKVPDLHAAGTGDVVFLLDVSRSMLSDDVAPSRLASAKAIAGDLAARFQGERVALVPFAGVPAVQCPLTIDRAFFRETLARASPDSVARGGTKIGDAIRFVLDSVFDNVERERKVLAILTDGGDQESSPESAATEASRRGIRLLVIGIGDEMRGASVPVSESDRTPISYRGAPVVTKLEPERLRSIAAASADSVYLSAGTSGLDSSDVYRLISQGRRREAGQAGDGTDGSPIFLAIAAALLVIEPLFSERKSRIAPFAALLLLLPVWASAESPARSVASGNKAFQNRHYETAVFLYQSAAEKDPNSAEIQYDLGVAQFRLRRYSLAAQAFQHAAEAAPGSRLAVRSALGQANCAYRQAMEAPPLEAALRLTDVLASYRRVLEMDPGLADARHNIGVVEGVLAELRRRLSRDTLPNLRGGKASTAARDIVREGRAPGTPGGSPARRDKVDKDW